MSWQPVNRLTQQFQSALGFVRELMLDQMGEASSVDDMFGILDSLTDSTAFQNLADTMAMNFTTMCNVSNERTWRQAAKESSKGATIYDYLMAETQGHLFNKLDQRRKENAELIRHMPRDLRRELVEYTQSEAFAGTRASDIADEIYRKAGHISRSRAKLIARTEVSKTMTALTEARARDVGINWYVWRTVDDARVRSSHEHMDGVFINWSDPPAPEVIIGKPSEGHYHAGNIYNCRCYPSPVLRLSAVKQLPYTGKLKVYRGGRINRLTIEEFQNIM